MFLEVRELRSRFKSGSFAPALRNVTLALFLIANCKLLILNSPTDRKRL